MKMTTTAWARKFLTCQGKEHSLSSRQRNYRSDLISVTAGLCNRSNVCLAPRWLIEPMIMHIPLVTRPHMLQKPQEELCGGKRQSLLQPIPVVTICDCHFPSIISDNSLFGKGWSPSIPATVHGSFPTVPVSRHHIYNKSARIFPIEPSDSPLRLSIPFERTPQKLQEIILPQASVLLRRKQMNRLPYAVCTKAAFCTQYVNMHVEAQVTPISVDCGHDTRNRRMLMASCAYSRERSLYSSLSHYGKQLAILEQDRPEFTRYRECQMPMIHIEQSALSACCGLLSASYSASRTESTLAPETNLVSGTAVGASVLHKPVAFSTTPECFGNRISGRLRNRSRQMFVEQSNDLLPMIGKDRNERKSRVHITIIGGFPRKMGLFFLETN
jgi:hypothetical protein